jgi:small subunit ribosomal protein S21
LTEIKLKKGEPVEKALRRLKKKIDREGTLRVVRSHRHYEKPSEKRRRKEKAARFSAMLTARYADLKVVTTGLRRGQHRNPVSF